MSSFSPNQNLVKIPSDLLATSSFSSKIPNQNNNEPPSTTTALNIPSSLSRPNRHNPLDTLTPTNSIWPDLIYLDDPIDPWAFEYVPTPLIDQLTCSICQCIFVEPFSTKCG